MITITPTLKKAIEIAAAFVDREVVIRLRLNPDASPDEVWAAVTVDGRILIGTPLINDGRGVYVDRRGKVMEA